jgi:hypothetical protein
MLVGDGRQLHVVVQEGTQHLEPRHGLCPLLFRQMQYRCTHGLGVQLLVMKGMNHRQRS